MAQPVDRQLFRVIDVETTGLDPRSDSVVELAWAIMLGSGTVLSAGSTLINPGRPIPDEASRVHNIYDRDVEGAPSLDDAVSQYEELRSPVASAVCHNATFDSAFLRRSHQFTSHNPRFLCTLRLAENLIPDCDSYKLESLRTQLDLAPAGDLQAHRASGDVAVTCALFEHLIGIVSNATEGTDVETLFDMATIQRMPFGKHRGRYLSDIPPDYVDWLLTLDDIDADLRSALRTARFGRAGP